MNVKYCNKDFYEPGKSATIKLLLRLPAVLLRQADHTLLRFVLYSTFLILVAGFFSACKEKKQSEAASANKDVYYTCSMHPQVIEDHPGNCPICGMKLIAVPKSSTNVTTQVRLSAEQIKLGN